MSPLFLGLDLSTQQLKAAIIDQNGRVVQEQAVHFDRDLPHYGTTGGALKGVLPGEVYCSVGVWVEALDILMQRLKDAAAPFHDIVAISGAAQQHGSVYWDGGAPALLASLDPNQGLTDQLVPEAFATTKCPIWQDSSTAEECKILEDAIGGPQKLSDITGSRAYERFTGPQILKLYRKHHSLYEASEHISLVSSFVTSLFLCKMAPIEASDASGMNLMNVKTRKWDSQLLEVCGGPTLRQRLGPEPVDGGVPIGNVGSWWVKRWGFREDCLVAAFTGDNPSTIVSLSSPGDAILSLGTSTTLLVSIPESETVTPLRTTTSHLLAHPTEHDGYIAMLCYKNGALAREQVRDQYAERSWDTFNKFIKETPTGNDGYNGFYFPLHEIIPSNVIGDFFFHDGQPIESFPDPKYHPRAIMESQLLSIRSRIMSILPPEAPHLKRLLLSGGSSANPVIRQLAADISGLKTYVAKDSKEGGSVGGAILALYAWWKSRGHAGSLQEMEDRHDHGNERNSRGDEEGEWTGTGLFELVATPDPDTEETYESLVALYRKCEHHVIKLSREEDMKLERARAVEL